jgi:hypothetical protein
VATPQNSNMSPVLQQDYQRLSVAKVLLVLLTYQLQVHQFTLYRGNFKNWLQKRGMVQNWQIQHFLIATLLNQKVRS